MNPFDVDWSVKTEVTVKAAPKAATSHADITVLIDRSSSMIPMHKAVVDGMNGFFESMRERPGDSRWTLIQFDDPDSARGAKEAFPSVIFEQRQEKDLAPLKMSDFQPRGTTALVDATCLALKQMDSRVSGQAHIKPIVMIVTDGQENASREFTSAKMREMIAERQAQGVEFQFLAANQDAWSEAGKYGLDRTYDASKYAYAGCTHFDSPADGAKTSYTFEATAAGIMTGLTSGMMGIYHTVSGSVRDGVRCA